MPEITNEPVYERRKNIPGRLGKLEEGQHDIKVELNALEAV
jgi:hypothetical protein